MKTKNLKVSENRIRYINIDDKYDTYEKIKKRVQLLIGARWQDKYQLLSVIKEQDIIRKFLDVILSVSEESLNK